MKWTKEKILLELGERELDLKDFMRARSILMNRIVNSRDHEETQLLPIHEWAGAHAVMNVFDLILHSMEGVVLDLKAELEKLDKQEIN